MVSYTVKSDSNSYIWSRKQLEEKIEKIRNASKDAVITKDLEVKTYSWAQRYFQSRKLEKEDIPGALKTMHQLKWQIPNTKKNKALIMFFNDAYYSLYDHAKLFDQETCTYNIQFPDRLKESRGSLFPVFVVQVGKQRPAMVTHEELKNFGEVFSDLKTYPGRVVDGPSGIYGPVDLYFPEFSKTAGEIILKFMRNEGSWKNITSIEQVIELLSAIEQFKIKNPEKCFQQIERLKHSKLQFKNHKDSLELVIKDHVCESELQQLKPFAKWISKIDLTDCVSVPNGIGPFHSATLVIHPRLDLSNKNLFSFQKLKLDLSNCKSGDEIKAAKQNELKVLAENLKSPLEIQGHQHLTSKKFVAFLLAFPKNCIDSLDFSEHCSITYDQLRSVLMHHSHIKTLDVSECVRIENSEEALSFAYIPTLCKELTSLTMDGLENGSIADIACILWNLPRLENASFRNWEDLSMSEKDFAIIKELQKTEKSTTALKSWDLSGTQINKDSPLFKQSLDLLAELLPKTLTQIILDNTNFAHDFIEAIIDREIALKALSIRHCNGVSRNVFKILADGCESLKKLRVNSSSSIREIGQLFLRREREILINKTHFSKDSSLKEEDEVSDSDDYESSGLDDDEDEPNALKMKATNQEGHFNSSDSE